MSKFKGSYYYNQAGIYKNYSVCKIKGNKIKTVTIDFPSNMFINDLLFLVVSSSVPIYNMVGWTLIALKQSSTTSQGYLQIYYKYCTTEQPGNIIDLNSLVDNAIMVCLVNFKYFIINTGQEIFNGNLTSAPIFGDKNLLVTMSNSNTSIVYSEEQLIQVKSNLSSFGVGLLNKPKSINITSSKTTENIMAFSIGLI